MTDTRYICSPLHNKLLATWRTISAGNHAYTRAYEYSDMKKGGREVVEGATIRSAPKQRPFDDRLIVLGWFIQREATPRWSNSFFFRSCRSLENSRVSNDRDHVFPTTRRNLSFSKVYSSEV